MANCKLRVRKFSPIDRNYPVFEVLDGEDILFDISKTDEGINEIAFHDSAAGRVLRLEEALAVISMAERMLRSV